MPARRAIAWTIGIAVSLAALLLVRLTWDQIADRRLSAAIDAARRAGDPVTAAEFSPLGDPFPDQNAVPALRQAWSVMETSPSPTNSGVTNTGYPPYPQAWLDAADAAVKDNAEGLRLARHARTLHKFYWSRSAHEIANPSQASDLNNFTMLATFLCDAAIQAQHHGNDLEAVERIADQFHVIAAVKHHPSMLAHVSAVYQHGMACERLRIIAAGLRIKPNDEADPLRQRLRTMIGGLLDDQSANDLTRRALLAERVAQIEWVNQPSQAWMLRPMYKLDLVRLLAFDAQLIDAAKQSHWPSIRAKMPGELRPRNAWAPVPTGRLLRAPRELPKFSRHMSGNPYLGFSVFQEMNRRADAHMTAAALAMHLHRADHAGAWPAKLESLVPRYLPAVPSDPLAPPGETLRLFIVKNGLPGGSDRLLLHSVGPDGIDGSAAGGVVPTIATYAWNWKSFIGRGADDEMCDLALWPAAPAATKPATQPTTVE